MFVLDAVITFVDCKHVIPHLDEIKDEGVENEAVEQVAFADVLVLNKTDLVSSDELDTVRTKLRGINANAKMLECQQSRVFAEAVLGIRAFDLDKTLQMDSEFLDTAAEHSHDNRVSSVGIVIEGDFHPDLLMEWLSTLLRTKGQDIFRSKVWALLVTGLGLSLASNATHYLLALSLLLIFLSHFLTKGYPGHGRNQ